MTCREIFSGSEFNVAVRSCHSLLSASLQSKALSSIAFVSDRSASNQIWTMNLQTKKLKQITGSVDRWINAHAGIEWSASNDKILFTASDGGYYTLYAVAVD